jgi:glycoprotein endo-alpha-1,2-mannosidase
MSFTNFYYTYNSSDDGSVEGERRIPEWSSMHKHRQSNPEAGYTSQYGRESSWDDEEVPSNPPSCRKSAKASFFNDSRQTIEHTSDHILYQRNLSSFRTKKRTICWVILSILITFFLGFFLGGFTWLTTMKRDSPGATQPGSSDTTGTNPPSSSEDDGGPVEDSPPNNEWAILVGAYYYPWYNDDFHRREGYVRKQLSPPQQPWLGEYDDTDPATISAHLNWSRQANIQLWVSSWWGPESREDVTLREVVLTHPELTNHKVAIFYETSGRIQESEGFSTHRVTPDMAYICEQYFDHPNYFRIEGKPVLFVYLTRKLEAVGNLSNVIDLMRSAAKDSGCDDVYIVGDHVFQGPPETDDIYPPLTVLDAVTNYDVYGSMGGNGGYVGRDKVVEYYEGQGKWRSIAKDHNCAFIPAASPGYNDLGVRPEAQHPPLSRRLSTTDGQGSLFEAAIREARQLVDTKAENLLIVNSFNEWHEDTQIEPAIGTSTSLPVSLTNHIVYRGYGELYLDILRRETQSTA